MMNKIISVILFMGVAHVVCASAPDGVSNGYNWHYTIDGQNMVLTIKDVTPTDAAEADLDISLVEIISGTYVVKIDDEAFKACKDLKTIILPSHVSRITAHAFAGCDKLTEINIRETKKVFVKSNNGLLVDPECGNLIACPKGRITAEIPFGITNVLQCAFKDCRSLKTLSVPITVKRMGAFAFDGCVNLETVYYGSGSNDGVRWGSIHFEEASSTYANNNPLYYAKRFCVRSLSIGADIPITSLSFPYSSEVNRYAFYGCKTIQSITLNKTRVNNRSFAECHSLSSMYIQNQGCEWGGTSFYGCTNLTSITLAGSATLDYKVVDGVVYSADEKRIMLFPPSKREYVVPETIFMPGDHSLKRFEYTFAGCRLLEKLVLPRTANYIMYDFIRDCGVEDVFTVYVPDSYQQVEPGAFDGCANGTTMIFEGDPPWKELWDYRRKIHEPNISRIGISAEHYDSWAENAKDLLPRCYIEYFNEKYEADGDHCACSGTTVPVGAINSGVTPTKVVINSQWESLPVTEITASSFMGYVQLVSVELPATLEIIGDVAFRDCERLELSELPKSVRRIGHNAFRGAGFAKGDNGCVILSGWILHADGLIGSYQIPTTVEHIADGAFAGCSQLNSIVIPLNVKTIGKSAFDGTGVSDSATGFVVRDGWLLAYNGDVPTNLTIPSTVRRIADGVFSYCKNLMSVTLPDTVEYVGDNAFAECEKLMEVSYDSRYTNFGRDVFVGGSADLRRQDRRYAEIIYDSQGGGHVQSRYQQRGTKIGELPIVEREHYMFLGWYTEKDGGEQVDENYLVEHSITIYAHWRIQTHVVTLDQNYPGALPVRLEIEHGAIVGKLFLPERDGYAFLGWYDDQFGGRLIGEDEKIFSDIRLFAKWGKVYAITYHSNGGSGTMEEQLAIDGVGTNLNSCVFTKADSVFCGWSTEQDGDVVYADGEMVSDFHLAVNGILSLYAVWTSSYKFKTVAVKGGGVSISGLEIKGETTGVLNVPSILDGKVVVGISARAFSEQSFIVSLTLPSSITNIADAAFYGCSGLKSVTLGRNVRQLGYSVFGQCAGIRAVTIPSNLAKMSELFSSSYAMITNATIYKGETKILDGLFMYCQCLQHVDIPETIQTFGGSCFYGCSNLREVEIPDGVEELGDNTFQGCVLLTSIKLPTKISRIGVGLFSGCSRLVDPRIPTSVRIIGENAFYNCLSIRSINIPSSVVMIEWNAFAGCGRLESVEISDLTNWFGIKFENKASNPINSGGVLFLNGSQVCKVSCPNLLKEINAYAFCGCTSLVSFVASESVTNIGASAFSGCTSLSDITLGPNILQIGSDAFSETDFLKQHKGVVIQDEYLLGVVGSCSVNETIPDNVRLIADSAFVGHEELETIVIPSSVKSVGCYSFQNCVGLASVALGEGLRKIGYGAFMGCRNLMNIDIPLSVCEIEDGAFSDCVALSNIKLPFGVSQISKSLFMNCTGLTNAVLANSVQTIQDYAFMGCNNLRSVLIPPRVRAIGYQAFKKCWFLWTIYVGRGCAGSVKSMILSSYSDLSNPNYVEIDIPFPEIFENAGEELIGAALYGVNDMAVIQNVRTVSEYNLYKEWTTRLVNMGVGSLQEIKKSNFSWTSYALDCNKLIEKSLASDDLTIEDFKPTDEAGRFDFVVRVKDIEIGSEALAENLKKVFGLTGAMTLDVGAFKQENVDVEFDTPQNGMLKFSAKPAKVSNQFFMRVGVK